jgi:uncharacterized protein (DUF433 family)
MQSHLERITLDPEVFGGRPYIRRQRVRAKDMLDMLAGAISCAEIDEDFPISKRMNFRCNRICGPARQPCGHSTSCDILGYKGRRLPVVYPNPHRMFMSRIGTQASKSPSNFRGRGDNDAP